MEVVPPPAHRRRASSLLHHQQQQQQGTPSDNGSFYTPPSSFTAAAATHALKGHSGASAQRRRSRCVGWCGSLCRFCVLMTRLQRRRCRTVCLCSVACLCAWLTLSHSLVPHRIDERNRCHASLSHTHTHTQSVWRRPRRRSASTGCRWAVPRPASGAWLWEVEERSRCSSTRREA